MLQQGFFATLPSLNPELLAMLIERGLSAGGVGPYSPANARMLRGAAEFPRPPAPAADLAAFLEGDELRAALGRIACMYDGGHLME